MDDFVGARVGSFVPAAPVLVVEDEGAGAPPWADEGEGFGPDLPLRHALIDDVRNHATVCLCFKNLSLGSRNLSDL